MAINMGYLQEKKSMYQMRGAMTVGSEINLVHAFLY